MTLTKAKAAVDDVESDETPIAVRITKKAKRPAMKRALDDDSFIVDSDDDIPEKKKPARKKAASGVSKSASAKTSKFADSEVPISETNLNEGIYNMLIQLGNDEKALGNNWKSLSFFKAANAIKTYGKVITSGNEAQRLKGIGKSIGTKIDQFLETGDIARSTDASDEVKLAASVELSKVFGLSKDKASALINNQNITTIGGLFGVQDMLDNTAKIGLKYFREFQEPFATEEYDSAVAMVVKTAQKIDPNLLVIPCPPVIDAIDEIHLIITKQYSETDTPQLPRAQQQQLRSEFAELLDALRANNFLSGDVFSDSIGKSLRAVCRTDLDIPAIKVCSDITTPVVAADQSKKPKTMMFSIPKFAPKVVASSTVPELFAHRSELQEVVKPLGAKSVARSNVSETSTTLRRFRRIELRCFPFENHACQQLHWTGPSAFVKKISADSEKRGFRLTDNFLRRSDGSTVNVSSEKEIFDALGLDYIEPKKRS